MIYNMPYRFGIFTHSQSKIPAIELEYFKQDNPVVKRITSSYKGDTFNSSFAQSRYSEAVLNGVTNFPK